MGRISFLHISDLHISKYPNLKVISLATLRGRAPNHSYCASHDPGKLKALVRLAHQLRKGLNVIVITGDISTTGLERDLLPSLRFVEGAPDKQDPRLSGGYPTLAGTGIPVLLLPGNHDRYKILNKKLGFIPGGRKFDQVFSAHWSDDVKINKISDSDLIVGIISADFNLRSWRDFNFLRSPIGFYAQGRVYEDILEKLVSETNDFIDANINIDEREVVVIWAVHFPPVAGPIIAPESELLGGEELIRAAERNGVSFIISGHLHKQFELSSPPTSVVPYQWSFEILGAGTASQFDSVSHCQVITIEYSGGNFSTEVEHYWFNEEANVFLKGNSAL